MKVVVDAKERCGNRPDVHDLFKQASVRTVLRRGQGRQACATTW